MLEQEVLAGRKRQQLEAEAALKVGSNNFVDLILVMLGNFSCFCCRLLTFLKINFFKKFFQEQTNCQTVLIQIRTDKMPVLILVQTVRKGYQQMTKVTASKESILTLVLQNKTVCHILLKYYLTFWLL